MARWLLRWSYVIGVVPRAAMLVVAVTAFRMMAGLLVMPVVWAFDMRRRLVLMDATVMSLVLMQMLVVVWLVLVDVVVERRWEPELNTHLPLGARGDAYKPQGDHDRRSAKDEGAAHGTLRRWRSTHEFLFQVLGPVAHGSKTASLNRTSALLVTVGEQAQRVHYHQERGSFMQGHRHADTRPAGNCGGDQKSDHAETGP